MPSVDPSTGMKATPTAGPSVSGRDSKKRGWKPPRTNVGAVTRNIGPSAKYTHIPTISPCMAVCSTGLAFTTRSFTAYGTPTRSISSVLTTRVDTSE
jgi:hypothetical protein